jgi:hypothetical protein
MRSEDWRYEKRIGRKIEPHRPTASSAQVKAASLSRQQEESRMVPHRVVYEEIAGTGV